MKNNFLGPLVVGLCFILVSCQDSNDNDTNGNPEASVVSNELTIQDLNGNQSSVFNQGDEIHFIITTKNLTDKIQSLQLQYSSSETFDIGLYDSDNVLVWNEHHDVSFSQSFIKEEVVFSPNEIRSFEVVWDQTDNLGKQVPAGTYIVYYYDYELSKQYTTSPHTITIQ